MMLAGLEQADENKVLKMCLFHDVAETRTGDANFINKLYLDLHEEEARQDQMKELPLADGILSLLQEYEQRESKEAVIAKDADLLDQMILQQEYLYNDEEDREIWHKHTEGGLKTKSAQELAQKIKKANPFEWLYQLAEDKVGEKIKRRQ